MQGAYIEHVADEAGLLGIKEVITRNIFVEAIQISTEHFLKSIGHIKQHTKPNLPVLLI